MNLRLFNRTTRSIALTDDGARFLDLICPILGALSGALADIATADGAVKGTLSINAPFTAIQLLLPFVVPGFLSSHPDVELELRHDERLVDIVADGCDAGIRLGDSAT